MQTSVIKVPKVVNTREDDEHNQPGRECQRQPQWLWRRRKHVTSKFNRKASRKADNLTNRVDNNKAGRVRQRKEAKPTTSNN